MAYPTPIVEIAFDDGPYVVSPTWTDVTAYVRGFSTSRGVPDDWTYQADGSANVTLSNRDRRFDPFNTTGPYYGKLLPRRQIRIRATSGGTTYDVFRGFISGWPPQWSDAGYDSVVELSCFDALQLLGSSSMPADWAMPYIQSLSPRHYWELDDPVPPFAGQSVTFKDRGSAASQLVANSTTVYQGPRLAEGLPSRTVATDAIYPIKSPTGVAPNVTVTQWTMSFWGQTTTTSAPSMIWFGYVFGGILVCFQDANVNSTDYGKIQVEFTNASNARKWHTTNEYEPGQPYHVAFTFDNGTGTIYVDGVADTLLHTNSSGITPTAFEEFQFGPGAFQQVALFPSLLTVTQIRTIFQFSSGQYLETSSARVSRIIGNTPFSSSLVSTPASPASDVLDLTTDAPTATAELTKVSDSEYAPLFVNKAGTLTLYSQSQIRSQTKSIVSQATYGAGGISIGTDIQLQYDGDSMRNVANVSMSAGGVYIAENSSSITTYAEAEQYVDTQVASYDDAVQISAIVTGWGGQVYPKASPVDVVLSPSASWGFTLGLELFERITLAVAPPSGNTITTPMLVSRISHSVTPERWSTTLEGSARWAAVFILNTSTLGGTDLLG